MRVHTDEHADRLSRSLNASAFTIGTDIFFRANQYDPGTRHGRRLLAHELTHVIQQSASMGAVPTWDLTPADDPGEREADRAAEDVARHGHAQPPVIRQTPLIQRKAFIGEDPKTSLRAEFNDAGQEGNGGAPREGFVTIPRDLGDLGTGERQVRTLVTDRVSRYFRDPNELYRYASRQTDEIGYVDREKTWVRLPEQLLVLGELHDKTTLPDLVEATGTTRYIYEAATTRPSPYLHPDQETIPGPHALEERLPKLVVGLIEVELALQPGLQALERRRPDWRQEIRAQQLTAGPAEPEQAERQYQQDLAQWSSGWERDNNNAAARGWRKQVNSGYIGARMDPGDNATSVLGAQAPDRPYTVSATAQILTLRALEEVREVTLGTRVKHPATKPIRDFYRRNREVIEATITQLRYGLPVGLTRMFVEMVTGNFNLHGLIGLLATAAQEEFTATGTPDVSSKEGYGRIYATAEAAQNMEVLRDSYMFRRILWAKRTGYRLVGLGENHRKNLQEVLWRSYGDKILVLPWTKFYARQYRLHPDRD